jgi:hypothetical protein
MISAPYARDHAVDGGGGVDGGAALPRACCAHASACCAACCVVVRVVAALASRSTQIETCVVETHSCFRPKAAHHHASAPSPLTLKNQTKGARRARVGGACVPVPRRAEAVAVRPRVCGRVQLLPPEHGAAARLRLPHGQPGVCGAFFFCRGVILLCAAM